MKKSLIFASVACAGALALHADTTGFTMYQEWFRGIGSGVTATNDMKSTNGSWNFSGVTSGDVSISSGSLVFDLDETESVSFNVTTPEISPDTNTWTDVQVTGVFSPVTTNDLPDQTTMNARQAQVGFVVGINDEPGTNYYAWVGGAEWIRLTGAVDPATVAADAETTLLVTFDYTVANAAKARFAILTGSGTITTNYLQNSSSVVWQNLATTARKVSGLSCYGSGSIKVADGAVGLAVAAIDSVKYGSLADAVTGAGTSAKTITVLRDTSENVSLPADSQITINDPGENIKGTVTVNENATVTVAAAAEELGEDITNGVYRIALKTHGGTVVVTLPPSVSQYKEILTTNVVEDQYIDVTLQTSSAIMNTLAAGGKTLNHDIAKLRKFLADYTNAAYTASNADKTLLDGALATPGGNGIPLWQSYELGVEPADSIAPVAAPNGDTDSSCITLAIPAIDPAKQGGDFDVKYKVGDTVYDSADAIKIPLPEAGSAAVHTIKVTLDPK